MQRAAYFIWGTSGICFRDPIVQPLYTLLFIYSCSIFICCLKDYMLNISGIEKRLMEMVFSPYVSISNVLADKRCARFRSFDILIFKDCVHIHVSCSSNGELAEQAPTSAPGPCRHGWQWPGSSAPPEAGTAPHSDAPTSQISPPDETKSRHYSKDLFLFF